MGKNLVYNGCMKYLLELRTVLKFQIKQHKGPGNFEVPYPYYFVSNIIFALYAHGYDQLQPHHLILSMYLTSFSLFFLYVLCRPFLEQVVLSHLCVDLNKTRTILEHLIQMLLAHSPINMSLQRVLFEINSNPKQKLLMVLYMIDSSPSKVRDLVPRSSSQLWFIHPFQRHCNV